jgi:6-methylsalicylate decarboxylase
MAFSGPGRIDVHHHCFPSTVPALASEFSSTERQFDVGFTGFFPSKPEDHLAYMDRVGIQTVVVVR